MIFADAERWRKMSALLDGVLDLPPEARAERIAGLRLDDPALADELAALVAGGTRADAAHFLDRNASLSTTSFGGPLASLTGTRVGAYVLEELLGQGGSGAVWRGRRADGRFDARVAIKLLHPSLIGRTGALRFAREGSLLARLSHSNIARLLDAGVTSGGHPYLVLELVDGERIDHHADRCRLPVAERIALFDAVLAAVAHAHTHLIIHRDIKPSNVLVDRSGAVKLLDFGIAKLLETESGDGVADITGARGHSLTPDYAAPEQLRGEPVTTATDVYSLGVLLYLLLTGQHPTAPPHASPADLIRATLDSDPERLATVVVAGRGAAPWNVARIAADRDTSVVRLKRQLGGDLENIVAMALRKVPGERYATVDALRADLRRWAAGEPVSARADSLAYRATRFVGRHRGTVAIGALALIATTVGFAGTVSQAQRAEQERAKAALEAEAARQQRDQALSQQRLQRGTAEFLQLLMRDAAGGDPGAIRRQLDRAVALIERTRFEHPLVKVALQRQIAGRYGEIGEWGEGGRLLRSAIASIEGTELAAPSSATPVNLACSLARYLLEQGDLAAASAELDRADGLLAGGAALSVPSRVECRVQRGWVAIVGGDAARGVSIMREALQTLADAGVTEGEQTRVIRSALSQVLLADGDYPAALAIAEPLLAESTAAQGRESIAVLARSAVVTRLRRLGGDPRGALPLAEADRETGRRLLGGDRIDAASELEVGRDLLELARPVDAAAAFARAASGADRGGRRDLAFEARLAEVEALVDAGRRDEARTRWAALAPLRAGASARTKIEALRVGAKLKTGQGDPIGARADLDLALQQAGAGARAQAFALNLARGELAVAAGDAAAPSYIERALAAARAAAARADRSSDIGRVLLLRARAQAATGGGDEARANASAALAQLLPSLGADHPAALAAAALVKGTSAATPARGR